MNIISSSIPAEKEIPFNELEQRDIYFALITVRDDDGIQIARDRVSKVVDLSVSHGGYVETIFMSLLFVSFGVLPEPSAGDVEENSIRVNKFLASIQEYLLENVTILHGQTNALVGYLGNNSKCYYGCILPNIKNLILELLSIPYGSVKEMGLISGR